MCIRVFTGLWVAKEPMLEGLDGGYQKLLIIKILAL